jgi:hypothetical protein
MLATKSRLIKQFIFHIFLLMTLIQLQELIGLYKSVFQRMAFVAWEKRMPENLSQRGSVSQFPKRYLLLDQNKN